MIDRTVEELQSSLEALVESHSETQSLLIDEIDRSSTLHSVVLQIRAMAERWVADGCNKDTAKDLVQLILAAITSAAPDTATELSEGELLTHFVPENYRSILQAATAAQLTPEQRQDAVLIDALLADNIQLRNYIQVLELRAIPFLQGETRS